MQCSWREMYKTLIFYTFFRERVKFIVCANGQHTTDVVHRHEVENNPDYFFNTLRHGQRQLCVCAMRSSRKTEIMHYLKVYFKRSPSKGPFNVFLSAVAGSSLALTQWLTSNSEALRCVIDTHTYTPMPVRPIKTRRAESTNRSRQTGHSSCRVLQIPHRESNRGCQQEIRSYYTSLIQTHTHRGPKVTYPDPLSSQTDTLHRTHRQKCKFATLSAKI